MMAQKNHIDPLIIELLFLKSEVDLSFCGGAYLKFREQVEGGTWEEDFSNLNNKIVYKNSIVEIAMFIY